MRKLTRLEIGPKKSGLPQIRGTRCVFLYSIKRASCSDKNSSKSATNTRVCRRSDCHHLLIDLAPKGLLAALLSGVSRVLLRDHCQSLTMFRSTPVYCDLSYAATFSKHRFSCSSHQPAYRGSVVRVRLSGVVVKRSSDGKCLPKLDFLS
jgi:hypothetical protein